MATPSPKDIISAAENLEKSKSNFENLWTDVARYCLPREENLTGNVQDVPGEEKPKPYNGIGILSAARLASGIFSHTVNMGRKWFNLVPSQEQLKTDDVTQWLYDTRDKVLEKIRNSNFSLKYHEMLLKYVTFGTGVLFEKLNDQDDLVFQSHSLDGVSVAENDDGLVDTVYRRFNMTAKQVMQRFSEEDDTIPSEIREKANSPQDQETSFEFIHAVFPRLGRNKEQQDAKNKPYASIYVSVKHEELVRESGYDLFPFQVPRFYKRDNEVYGRCEAMNALPDLRMLNRAEYDHVTAIEMLINPPLFLPEGTEQEDVDLTPGATNSYNAEQGAQIHEYGSSARVDLSADWIAQKEQRINEFFFVDLFQAMQQQENMTATEVQARINEKIQTITPVVSRLNNELFERMVERIVALMYANDELEPVPEALIDQNGDFGFKVEYTTELQAKLQQLEVQAALKAIGQTAQAAEAIQVTDEIRATFDLMKLARWIARQNNVDGDFLRDESDAEEFMQKIAQQRQQAQQQQAMQDVVSKMNPAEKPDPGSPISELAQQAQKMQ